MPNENWTGDKAFDALLISLREAHNTNDRWMKMCSLQNQMINLALEGLVAIGVSGRGGSLGSVAAETLYKMRNLGDSLSKLI